MDLLFIPSWRAIAFRGALALAFAVGAFLWPSVTMAELVLLFGVYALLDGTVAILVGSRVRRTDRGWLLPLEGLLGVALGLMALAWTGASPIAITLLVGVWALLTGTLEVAASIRLRRDVPGEAFLAFGGAASIALGVLLLFAPHAGSLVLVVLFGSYALVFGAAMLMLAMQLRDHERRRHSGPHLHAY
jgi:uncharacterized membrane protein HdeD (DUF308 family)